MSLARHSLGTLKRLKRGSALSACRAPLRRDDPGMQRVSLSAAGSPAATSLSVPSRALISILLQAPVPALPVPKGATIIRDGFGSDLSHLHRFLQSLRTRRSAAAPP